MTCFAPLILAGYLFTLHPNPAHISNVDAYLLELQTCDYGLGMHARMSTAGLFAIGIQYGFQWEVNEKWTLTFQPRAGLSSSSQYRPELPLYQQFELGGQLLLGYDNWRVGLDYWHLSNAGMKDPNIGLDMIGLVGGWRF